MPGHKTHKAVGVTISILAGIAFLKTQGNNPLSLEQVPTFLIGLTFAFLFSFLPDIDTAASKARKLFNFSMVGSIIYFSYIKEFEWIIFISIILILVWLSKHRGIFHKWYAPFVIGLPFVIYQHYLVYVMAVSSYLSHIFLDKINTKMKRTF